MCASLYIQISEEDVDNPKAEAQSLYDYPPRVTFQMTPTAHHELCTLQFRLTGMIKDIYPQYPLRRMKHYGWTLSGESQALHFTWTNVKNLCLNVDLGF